MVGPPAGKTMMTEWLGLPALASANGQQIDNLIGWMHVFMFILFVGWGGFFLYTLVRFRRSRHPVASYTGAKTHTSSYLEVAVALRTSLPVTAGGPNPTSTPASSGRVRSPWPAAITGWKVGSAVLPMTVSLETVLPRS